jgi:hypothetical protein
MHEALNHNDSNNDTLTHHIPQTTNQGFVEILIGATANDEASLRGCEGTSTQQGAQAKGFAANITTTELPLNHHNKHLYHPSSIKTIEI